MLRNLSFLSLEGSRRLGSGQGRNAMLVCDGFIEIDRGLRFDRCQELLKLLIHELLSVGSDD